MSITIDANMILFANRLNITSTRMVNDYGDSTIDEIIQSEAAQGNHKAIDYASELYSSPLKLVEMFRLNSVENRYRLIVNMKESVRRLLLPMLSQDDLRMGLYFFTKEKLLEMLLGVDKRELLRVLAGAFTLEKVVQMLPEEELMKFYQHKDLKKENVIEQIKNLPPEMMKKFIEDVTGKPSEQTNPDDLIRNIESLNDEKFKKFMTCVDPQIQRQLFYQLADEDEKHLFMVPNMAYVEMLQTLPKPEMVKPMIELNQFTLIDMVMELPPDFLSIVAAQIDATDFATFLQHDRMRVLEIAKML